MSGGFIPSSSSPSRSRQSNGHDAGSRAQPLLALTAKQEGRLRAHLDDRLLQLERDDTKNAFGSLSLLLVRLRPVLSLILQIPPPEPWGGLRVSYFLAYTGAVIGYVTSLPLLPADPRILGEQTDYDDTANGLSDLSSVDEASDAAPARDDAAEASQVMWQLITLLRAVDEGWQAVLRGDAWVAPVAEGAEGAPVKVDFGAEVGATERTRLRSILVTGREKIIAWARTYGHFAGAAFPAAPSLADDDDSEENTPSWTWESEITTMWNGTLDALARTDFGDDGQ